METAERISKAVETYDHIFWESIIQVCNGAISKTFSQTGNSVRVVYEVCKNDPRKVFPEIKARAEYYISRSMEIRKIGKEYRDSYVANNLCSNGHYQLFLRDMFFREQGVDFDSLGNFSMLCDFVELKDRYSNAYICCPCTGEHLENTRDLAEFEIKLHEPKKVGRNTYEFRFEII